MTTLVAPWATGSIDDSSVTLNNYNYRRRRAGRNGEREREREDGLVITFLSFSPSLSPGDRRGLSCLALSLMGWQSAFFLWGVPKNDGVSQLSVRQPAFASTISIRGGVFCFTRKGQIKRYGKEMDGIQRRRFRSPHLMRGDACLCTLADFCISVLHIFPRPLFFFFCLDYDSPLPPVRKCTSCSVHGSLMFDFFLLFICIWFKLGTLCNCRYGTLLIANGQEGCSSRKRREAIISPCTYYSRDGGPDLLQHMHTYIEKTTGTLTSLVRQAPKLSLPLLTRSHTPYTHTVFLLIHPRPPSPSLKGQKKNMRDRTTRRGLCTSECSSQRAGRLPTSPDRARLHDRSVASPVESGGYLYIQYFLSVSLLFGSTQVIRYIITPVKKKAQPTRKVLYMLQLSHAFLQVDSLPPSLHL